MIQVPIKNPNESQLLTEYESVREELNEISKSIKQFNITTITISAAAILFSIQFENQVLSLLGFCYTIISFIYVKAQKLYIRSLGIYIAVFIESRLKELSWYSVKSTISDISNWGRIGWDSTLLLYVFISSACAAAFYYISIENRSINKCWRISLLVFILVIILGMILFYAWNRDKKYHSHWRKKYDEIYSNKE